MLEAAGRFRALSGVAGLRSIAGGSADAEPPEHRQMQMHVGCRPAEYRM